MMRWIPGVMMLWATTVALSPAFAASEHMPGGYDHGHMWGSGWGWMILGPVMMIGVIAAIVAVVVLLVRWLGGGHGATQPNPSGKAALDVLEQRFARGEIDREEFEERRRVLHD